MKSAFDWLRSTSLKISAGELKEIKPPPGENATAEEKAAWRKEQGIPENGDGYVTALKLPQGVVLGEADKPLVKSFADAAAAAGMQPEAFNQAVQWYFQQQDALAQERQGADRDFRVATERALIEQMGPDFKANMNALQSFWGEQPKGISDTILTARTADGRMLGDMPEVVSMFVNLSRELNPAATLLPPGGQTDLKGIESRLGEIQGMMYKDGKNNPAYWGNEALQKEYRELVDAQTKMKARTSA